MVYEPVTYNPNQEHENLQPSAPLQDDVHHAEQGNKGGLSFDNRSIRQGFVRKVFCWVTIMMLITATIATGYMSAVVCAQYTAESVVLSLIVTTVVCALIIVFAMQTKYDLTSCMGYMFIFLMVIFVTAILLLICHLTRFYAAIPWLSFVYTLLITLFCVMYLAMDIQMLMGGEKIELSPEEHVMAAIQIYLDVLNLFWLILSLLGKKN
ncbi:hypothetical protein WR25_19447 [Diploscapter pachys]|uniref:Uncharacterized protein n=1 Tax=Diploscapter pachys TaxID=2018661 RepID=A0A2A2JWH1_9BILA|nr:hypothetical protein WR25_19447 [Diploscapter pachys]